MVLLASDTAEHGTFAAIFARLDTALREMIGRAMPRLLVIPLHGGGGNVIYADAFSFQSVPVYGKLGVSTFGAPDDGPPGGRHLFVSKRFACPR